MSAPKKASSLSTVLIVCACAAIAIYVAFLRGKGGATDLAPTVSAEVPAVKTEAPPPTPPAPVPQPEKIKVEPPARSVASDIQALCDEGKWRAARGALSTAFAGSISDGDRDALARKGPEIHQKLLLQEPDEKDVLVYEILQGDTLEGIARKFKDLNGVKGNIMLVNGYKENAILRAGRKVKLARGTWTILVDKSLFKLFICYEGAPFKSYTVTIGTDQKTVPGQYTVGVRNPKPAWWPPPELNIKNPPVKYGDPQNPLGEWWVSLEHDTVHGLGIHGTNDPKAIGSKASNGCVRMLNEEVGEVAAIAYKGMKVTIVE